MDVIEAITTRKSIRAYKPDPVPRDLLQKIIQTSLRAPSYDNTQPWEFIIIGGEVNARIKRELANRIATGEPANPDIGPGKYPEEYWDRSRENGKRLFEILGIPREDKEKRKEWYQVQARAFEAPNSIIICIDRSLPNWSLVDTGIILQTILLTAKNYGLGTCTQAVMIAHPDILRNILNIPESKLIVCGIAIGYPDDSAPVNQWETHRLPINNFVTWKGFD